MWLYIIIGIIVLGIISAIVDWIKIHKGIITLIVITGICIFVFGFMKTVIIYAVLFVVLLVLGCVITYIERKNEEELNKYLNDNCLKCGYVTLNTWKKMLPQYVTRQYDTSFEEITMNFSHRIEKEYIEQDSTLKWLDPAVLYLIKNSMADVLELEKVPSENLNYTHITPNAQLIFEAMENLCKAKVINGKHMIQKITLEDDGVRKQLNLSDDVSVPMYYKAAYKINDHFKNMRKDGIEGNIDSEEVSFDDL